MSTTGIATLGRMLTLSMAMVFMGAASPQNIAAVPVARLDQPWWKARFAEKQQELRQKQVDLLWLGDSITQNWELAGPEPWRAFASVWNRYYGDRHAVNLGFKGDSTCHLLWRLQHGELDFVSPRAVIVLIGANNFGHVHTDAMQTSGGIDMILDEVHRRLPKTQIILLGVLPSIRSPWVSANTTKLNAMLSLTARTRQSYVTFIDLSYIFLRDGHVDATRFLDPKLSPPDPPLHPTAQTQQLIALAIEPTVARLLADYVHKEPRQILSQ